MQAGGCKAKHSGAASVPSLSPDRTCCLCSTSSIGPLNRSTMPLVCGDLGGAVGDQYRELSKAFQTRLPCCGAPAHAKKPVGERLAIPVKMVRIRIGHARFRSPRQRRALAAVLWRYMAMKTQRLAQLIATKRYPRDVSLAMCGGYFTSMWVYPGLYALDPLCLGVSSLALRSRRLSHPCLRRQRSKPERDTFGFRNSRTTANRSSSDTVTFCAVHRHGLLRWCQGGLKTVWVWGGGCDPEHCRACAISGKSAQWLRGVLPRPTQVHHAPEWPPVSLVSLSPRYDVEQALVSAV